MLRSTHENAKGDHPIILRLIYRGQRRDTFTGLYCKKVEWDKDLGRVKKVNNLAGALNRNLDIIHRKAYDAFEGFHYNGLDFTIDELVEKIKGKEEAPTLLMDYLEDEKKRIQSRLHIDISPATVDKYRRSASHVQHFLQTEFKVKNYALQRINASFLEKYFQYLRGTRGISHNSSVKYVVFFKTILMPAIRAGVFRQDPFREVKLKQKPVFKGFLTKEEMELLTSVELKSPDLDRIRDIFLFSCYTGLAYSDLKQLSRYFIQKDNDDTFYIRKPRQKTGQESIVPLLPPAIRILKKYSPTEDFRDFVWYVSTNQKMNQRLKTIGSMAGIGKELHMHLARHTFATTVTLSNGVPIESVSSMLGHASLKQTQHYAKVVSHKLKGDMAKISGLFK
ncbi:site-specific integrase [Paracnuella aquatica]|uniref:site-specific integrase n=1 Tax=Paracnuella aquatica TaxID=2268757 RepID=UPI00139004C0|nr:site-specific integrase [Paracnuella aquatica]